MRFLCGVGPVLVALLLSVPCNAQTQGSITGEVRDAAGAAVPNANVTVTDVATGVVRNVPTNADGIFAVPNLIPDIYTVQVQATGFMTLIFTNVQVQVQQDIRLNFALHAGQGTETSTGGSAQLETENAGGGEQVENRRVVGLPMEGRDYMQMIPLAANSNNTSGSTMNYQAVGNNQSSAQGGTRALAFFAVSGQRPSAANYTLDGFPNNDVNLNLYILQPSLDAIKEMKVQSGIYPAEFGREAGQVNVSTISGGNQYHGSLFEFLRNNKVDAVTYQFTPIAPANPPFKWNQYGFTLSGPLSIPKVFDAKNKLFFMANFEGFRQRSLTNTPYTVATPAMRAGDLSPGLAVAKGAGLLYYPFGRTQNADGTITAVPIPGNIIPTSQIHPDSTIMLDYEPLPNQPFTGTNLLNDYLATPATPVDKDQFTSRMDFNENAKSTWFARFSWTGETTITPLELHQGQTLQSHGNQYQLANTRTFSSSKVNEARFGISTFHNLSLTLMGYSPDEPWAVDVVKQLKLPGIFTDRYRGGWGSPQMRSLGGGLSNFGDSTWTPDVLADTIMQGNDNFSWIHGKHSLRFGGLLRRDRYNHLGGQYSNGYVGFNGYTVSNPSSVAGNYWTGWGSFMLGVPNQMAAAVDLAYGKLRTTSTALYIDDSWHVSPKVTVSLGLRWEYQAPWWDQTGNSANMAVPYVMGFGQNGSVADMKLHPTLVRTGSGGYYDGLKINYPGVQVTRDGSMGRGLLAGNPRDFAPRLGVSWSPSARWAIRLGVGMFNSVPPANQVWALVKNTAGTFNIPNNVTMPTFDWTNYLTSGAILQLPQPALNAVDYNIRTPKSYQWMLNVQRRLNPSTMVDLTYSGSVSKHLYWGFNPNMPLAGTTPLASRTPFPEMGIVTSWTDADRSSYEAGAARISRRAHGVTFSASLTWARSMDYGSEMGLGNPQNARCLSAACGEYGPSMFDVKFRTPLSFVYDLPFGKGEKFANTGGVVGKIVGGWQLSVVYNLQTGSPILTTISNDQGNTGGVTGLHPDATGLPAELPSSKRSPGQWFNKAAFSLPAFGSFGNLGRDVVRAPGKNKGDVTLARNFKILEGHTLQFRFEVYNFLNHPNWGVPGWYFDKSNFATITQTSASMRQIQFSMKYTF